MGLKSAWNGLQESLKSMSSPSSTSPKIQLRGITKRFGKKVVLDSIDLDVIPGESLVVIGGSGSGKSVLLKCILGLLTPDAGTVMIDGEDVTHMSLRQREKKVMHKFGMLFQGGALFDSMRVWENVSFGLTTLRNTPPKEAKDIAIAKLAEVGLKPDVAELFPVELSGGMQKRVALARAIATDPEIIFFDEPTTGLDPIMADVINHLIVECVQKLGATAVTITHDMGSVRKIARHVAMIYNGKIIWYGPADQIDHSNNDYVDQFIHGRAEGPIEMAVRRD